MSLKISSRRLLLKGNCIYIDCLSFYVNVYPPTGTLMIDYSIIFPLKTAAICVEQWPESNPIPVKNPAPNSESTAYKLIYYYQTGYS